MQRVIADRKRQEPTLNIKNPETINIQYFNIEQLKIPSSVSHQNTQVTEAQIIPYKIQMSDDKKDFDYIEFFFIESIDL